MEKLKKNSRNVWASCMHIGRCIGCHQRPDRSFFFHGNQFPVCARCTGVIIGEFVAILLFMINIRINFFVCLAFCGIMFGDWLIQKLTILESTNTRRLITGILGGYGYITILCKLVLWLAKTFLFIS